MSLLKRITRHLRLSWLATGPGRGFRTPPFLTIFVNSVCNLRCEHCFYWRSLNKADDLTFDEIRALSEDLGKIENLYLSGGEPFLRRDIAGVCSLFIRNNKVDQIYVPTNAYHTEKTVRDVREVLKEKGLKLFAVEISLDGTEEFHNRFRGSKDSFRNAIKTYDALEEVQREDPRLRLHAVSTVNAENIEEVRKLTAFLFDRCPAMDHHNISMIRGDRKNPTLQGPELVEYRRLVDHVTRTWALREKGRTGGIVEPMIQWAKMKTAREQRQVIPCCAGILSGVVYANGDVALCETLPPVGSLRQEPFTAIWRSREAAAQRRSISNKDCYCTNVIYMWPSITFQPLQLVRAMLSSRPWKRSA